MKSPFATAYSAAAWQNPVSSAIGGTTVYLSKYRVRRSSIGNVAGHSDTSDVGMTVWTRFQARFCTAACVVNSCGRKGDESTPMTEAEGYAGTFHILGHGGCYGDIGHCEVTGDGDDGHRPPHCMKAAEGVAIRVS